jgi:hypothetical protein
VFEKIIVYKIFGMTALKEETAREISVGIKRDNVEYLTDCELSSE